MEDCGFDIFFTAKETSSFYNGKRCLVEAQYCIRKGNLTHACIHTLQQNVQTVVILSQRTDLSNLNHLPMLLSSVEPHKNRHIIDCKEKRLYRKIRMRYDDTFCINNSIAWMLLSFFVFKQRSERTIAFLFLPTEILSF